jgi:hypothetical protein
MVAWIAANFGINGPSEFELHGQQGDSTQLVDASWPRSDTDGPEAIMFSAFDHGREIHLVDPNTYPTAVTQAAHWANLHTRY